MSAHDTFSDSYAEAREKFLNEAGRLRLPVTTYRHPSPGRDGEALALDAARFGDPSLSRLLVVSSGCHGVEGYCGSGAQIAAMRDDRLLARAQAAGVGLLMLHAINPYGFSHIRRVTQENVDLNRNFIDFSARPDNPAYREIHEILLPRVWPPDAANQAQLQAAVAAKGLKGVQAAVSGGQYEFADGLFFGGREPTWSHRTIRGALRELVAGVERLAWIDLHTGLGPTGHGELMFVGCDAAGLNRARRWWGSPANPIVTLDGGESVSAPLTGTMWSAFYEECAGADITPLAVEFGTQPLLDVLHALRAEQWLANHAGEASPDAARAIKRGLREAFYVDAPEWKDKVLAQVLRRISQAIDGLAED